MGRVAFGGRAHDGCSRPQRRVKRTRVVTLTASGAGLVGLTALGLAAQRNDRLDTFLAIAALQAVVYLVAVWAAWDGTSRRVMLGIAAVAALMRVAVVFAPPYLSSDIYRYVWDGRVAAAGINPYAYTPSDPRLEPLRDSDIFPQIASLYAPTIYPPAAEVIFLGVTRISASVTAMKAAMVGCEIVVFVLLARLLAAEGLPTGRVVAYAWHPLPLWEFAGSGHIDAALVAFSVAALWAGRRGRDGHAGLFLAGATLTKLYPAILLSALYRRWDWKLPIVFGAAIVLAYLPFIGAGSRVFGFLPGYAAQEGFAANGDGFYLLGLLRDVPPFATLSAQAYTIGALATLAALSTAFMLARDTARSPFAAASVLATAFVIAVSPHYPWYFAWLIVFACFVRSYALLWLTNACLLLYLIPGYVFVQSEQRLAIESAIYGPFAALALVDIWYHSRRSIRSRQPCPSA
jgi:alpha-1,6-mannosyltransferase